MSTLWHDPQTATFYIGNQPVERLAPMHRRILRYLLAHANVCVTKSDIIKAAWPAGTCIEGVTDEALQQQISTLRKRLRCYSRLHYIRTWRGIPEGGYRLLADGQLPKLVIPRHHLLHPPTTRGLR